MGTLKVVFVLVIAAALCSSDEVDYYTKLIKTEVERSLKFTLPTNSQSSKPYKNSYIEYGTFDHIVIGAGSAGAVIASRLSEDPFRNVLVLEAGGYETNFTDIPGMAGSVFNLEYNWNYETIPQSTSCLGMHEKRCIYPRGKAIGGSSTINCMIYTRGNKLDYDNWCAQGNPGWCYKDVLPFFKKSENSKIDGDPGYHGFGGNLYVEYTEPTNIIDTAFIEANEELNRAVVDYNGVKQEGVGRTQISSINGRRESTGKVFLRPALQRKNLVLEPFSHVVRIIIRSKRAHGVLFAKNNQYYVARSRKDIIVSAGTIGSAQLLMLSGLGPKSHLKHLKIPVIKDLAVGKNFQDHVMLGMLHFETNFTLPKKNLEDNVRDYLKGEGLLTNMLGSKSIAFLRTHLNQFDEFPDVEFIQVLSSLSFSAIKPFLNYNLDTYKKSWTGFDYERSFTICLLLLRPLSRGYIELKSADPFEYPIIDSNLLSDAGSVDIDTMYEGIQLLLGLLETNAFKKLGVKLHPVHLPQCQQFKYMSKGYWYCHLRQLSSSITHIVGTCKMGPNASHGAVVDHKLKVHGIDNLRVADASIMPNVPSAHTNAPAIMVGEKAAYMIRFK